MHRCISYQYHPALLIYYVCTKCSKCDTKDPSVPSPPRLPLLAKAPPITIPNSTLPSEWLTMVNNEHLSDVQFYYKTDCYYGHKIVLCAASKLFRRIFETDRELEAEESLSECKTWNKTRINTINKQCINDGAVGAFRNIYDKYETIFRLLQFN